MTPPLRVVIGFDKREEAAYKVCRHSLLRHASIPLMVTRLDLRNVSATGIYDRPFTTENGQMTDAQDGRPFSTEHAFSRFMTPALCLYDGWAISCDSDFLYTDDIANLLPLLDDRYAVMVVKKQHQPTEQTKMDGQSQAAYPRKNWSSFIVWNNAHRANRALTIKAVNAMPGRWLHGFEWLTEDQIGSLPQTWNWLAGIDAELDEIPAAIHHTLGTPDLSGYENSPYADLWREELARAEATLSTQQTLRAVA